jgi:hypothetical protein
MENGLEVYTENTGYVTLDMSSHSADWNNTLRGLFPRLAVPLVHPVGKELVTARLPISHLRGVVWPVCRGYSFACEA